MDYKREVKVSIQKGQRLWIFLLLFVMVGIGFFVPISMNDWTGILIKVLLYGAIFLVLYVFLSASGWSTFPLNRLHQVDQKSSKEMISDDLFPKEDWKGFGKVLSVYIEEFLSIIRNVMVGSSVGLYLYEKQGHLEFHIGENEYQRITKRQIMKGESIVEQIAKQKIAVLEDNLPIGTVLEGISDSEIRSLVGAPLIWEDEVVGAIAVGSKTTGSFGDDDRDFLSRCGQLITQVMAICYRGVRLEMNQEVYKIHLDLEQKLKHIELEDHVISEFVQHVKQLFPMDRFTFCLKENNEGVIHYVNGQVDNMNQGMRFPLDEGLNGWILKRNMPLLLADMQGGNMTRSRYFRNEDTKHGLRSFLGIPLGSEENAWGCLSLESRVVGQYNEKTKEVLCALGILLQMHIERIRLLRKFEGLSKNDALSSLSL